MKNVSFLTNPHVVTIEQSLEELPSTVPSFSLWKFLLPIFIGVIIAGLIGLLTGVIKITPSSNKESEQHKEEDETDLKERNRIQGHWS